MKLSFKEEILSLIQSQHEGEYWDFKRQWYNKEKPASLLFDIICLANNTAWRNAYIIIGIDEEKGYQLLDVSNDVNRRNTQELVCFLRDKHFAGGIRPEVEVRPILMSSDLMIDVIVIKATRHTPYYLVKDMDGIRSHHIYSRVMDSNTDRDKSADPHIVELLWANRFGLNATALERAQLYIRKPEDWIEEDNEDCSSYHSVFPEYKVSHYSEDDRTGYEYYLFSQFDSTPHWWRIDITYHQTVLYSRMGIALDGGRAFVPCPEKEFIDLHSSSNPLMICCYVKGSMRYDLFRFFCEKDTATEAEYAIHRFLECIIVFESESEKQGFLEYARYKIENYTLDEDRLFLKEMPECYYKDYMTAIKAQRLLRIYRLLQTKSAEEDLDYATNECGVAHSEDMG